MHVAIWFYVAKEKDSTYIYIYIREHFIYIYRERERIPLKVNGWYQLAVDEKRTS